MTFASKVLAFLNLGQKFSRCRSFNNITPRVTCKVSRVT